MTITVEERLRRAGAVLDEYARRHIAREDDAITAGAQVPAEPTRPRRSVLSVLAVAAVGAVVLGLALVNGRVTIPTVDAPAASPRAAGSEGWDVLTDAPISARFQHLAVSSGDQVLIWGGYGAGPLTDGALYDVRSNSWRKLPAAPLARDRGDAVGTWTGTAFIVLNGIEGDVRAAAFDPVAFEWQALPDPPLTNAASMSTRAVVVGGAVVVVSVSAEQDGVASHEVARLEPWTSTWRTGADPPAAFASGFDAVVWGEEVIVIGDSGRGGDGCGAAVVVAYSPLANSWRELPNTPIRRSFNPAVTAIDGGVLVAGGRTCGGEPFSRAVVLDPASASWREAAAPPVEIHGSDRYADPAVAPFAVARADDGRLALFDGRNDRWVLTTASPLNAPYSETPFVPAGDRLLVFSGGLARHVTDGVSECCDLVDGGYLYSPPAN